MKMRILVAMILIAEAFLAIILIWRIVMLDNKRDFSRECKDHCKYSMTHMNFTGSKKPQ